MARHYVGTTWNSAASWSDTSGGAGGAGVPTITDDVILDSGGTNNLTCDAAINCASFTVDPGYTGTLDFADNGYTHNIDGDVIFAGVGTVDCGDATITVAGNFSSENQSIWIDGTGHWVFTGTGKTISSNGYTNRIRHATFDGSHTITGNLYIVGSLVVNIASTVSINSGKFLNNGSGTIINGSITGLGTLNSQATQTIGATGSVTCSAVLLYYVTLVFTTGATFDPGTVNARVYLAVQGAAATLGGSWTMRNQSGDRTFYFKTDIIFTGDVLFTADGSGSLIIDNVSWNKDLTFHGDVLVSEPVGTVVWNKGTGTISLSGSANQSIDFNGLSIEAIDMDKTAGAVTEAGDVTTDAIIGTGGTLDLNGYNLTTVGGFTGAPGAIFNDTAGGGLVTVGGNFALNGTSGNPIIWNGPDLDITGSAAALYTTISNSDATAGTQVDATANCTDGGGNVGWNFSSVIVLSVQGASQSQTADNIALTQGYVLSIADSLQAQISGNINLVQAHLLTVNGCTQTQLSDSVDLSQAHVLSVQDALHGHISENVALIIPIGLLVDDALHAQLSDNLILYSGELKLPPEYRQFQIQHEDRLFLIPEEDRVFAIH